MRAARGMAKNKNVHVFAGAGSPALKAAESGPSGFRRGGRAKRANGSAVPGVKAKARLDRKGRAAGGAVMSSGHKSSPATTSTAAEGKQGVQKGTGSDVDSTDPAGYARGGRFIKSAIKHRGSFRNAAERAGMTTREFAEKHKHSGGTTGRRARLALTLARLRPD